MEAYERTHLTITTFQQDDVITTSTPSLAPPNTDKYENMILDW